MVPFQYLYLLLIIIIIIIIIILILILMFFDEQVYRCTNDPLRTVLALESLNIFMLTSFDSNLNF